MAVPVLGWITQNVAMKLGVAIGVDFAMAMAETIQSQGEKDIGEHDQKVRTQSIQNLSNARIELKDTQMLAKLGEHNIQRDVFLLSRQLSGLVDKIRFSGLPKSELSDSSKEAVTYLNIILLSKTYSVIQQVRELNDSLSSGEEYDLGVLRAALRDAEGVVEIRGVLAQVDEENIIKYVADMNPELFVSVRALAGMMYRMEEMKKPAISTGRYVERVQGLTLYILDDVLKQRGPIVGFTELYNDFRETYPRVEVTQKDYLTAITGLSEQGMIEGLTERGDGYKVIKIKPLKLTEPYENVLSFLTGNIEFLESGVSREDLAVQLGYTPTFSEDILEEMASDDIAWKHEGKYYFPGLAETAYTLKTQTVEAQ